MGVINPFIPGGHRIASRERSEVCTPEKMSKAVVKCPHKFTSMGSKNTTMTSGWLMAFYGILTKMIPLAIPGVDRRHRSVAWCFFNPIAPQPFMRPSPWSTPRHDAKSAGSDVGSWKTLCFFRIWALEKWVWDLEVYLFKGPGWVREWRHVGYVSFVTVLPSGLKGKLSRNRSPLLHNDFDLEWRGFLH